MFNVYMEDENGYLYPLAMNVECKFNPLDPDDLILINDNNQENVDYYIDGDN